MDIIRVSVLGIVGMLMAQNIKKYKPEMSVAISIAVCLFFLFNAVKYLTVLSEATYEISALLGEHSAFIDILLKAVGITYICEFCASICKDAGYNAIAAQIEMFGKFSILLIGMPVLKGLLETIVKFAG